MNELVVIAEWETEQTFVRDTSCRGISLYMESPLGASSPEGTEIVEESRSGKLHVRILFAHSRKVDTARP